MGVPMNGSGAGDMFLAVKGARSGAIEGESEDSAHPKEIEVVAWSWGMNQRQVRDVTVGTLATSQVGGKAVVGRANVQELKIFKSIDTASTALMWALRTNEPITSATLTMRKAGTSPLEFLKIVLGDARVSSISLEGGVPPGSVGLVEVVTFAFNKITVDYFGQGKDGQSLGGRSFEDEFRES